MGCQWGAYTGGGGGERERERNKTLKRETRGGTEEREGLG